ncbi:M1 family peptidase [Corallococcus sp. H22C18031201]|nr:M1 family peptidase [Corallococcus sp. H22C18031201]
MSRRLLLLCSVLVACGAPQRSGLASNEAPSSRAVVAKAEFPPAPALRIPEGVRPTGYAAELTVDPKSPTFEGVVDIALEVSAPASVVWLHGEALTVKSASLEQAGQSIPVTLGRAEAPWLGFSLGRPLAPGAARMHIVYQGAASSSETHGAFRVEEGGDWYVYTQFEPLGARRVFPSFDEPGFKVPWQLTLHVPAGVMAVSNTDVEAESEEAGGGKVVRFARTQPLPSYLIAFGVGPFQVAEAGPAGQKHVRTRVITPRGRVAEAEYAAKVTPELLARIEDYFGMPYPYEKLDVLSVAHHSGAMEHPGLITFQSALMLAPPGADSIDRQRSFAIIQAHELGHQWFGNLVTPSWWDDLWLNESFASWISLRIVDGWQPSWQAPLEQMKVRGRALNSDRLVAARHLRQPIASVDDISSAFDGITYGKGSSVLTMAEEWLGRDTFRQGIQRYVRAHAGGTATSGDFLSALSAAAGRDVGPVLGSFMDQGGAPLVSVSLDCTGPAPRVTLRQQRYLPLGSTGAAAQSWKVPLCLKYGVKDQTLRTCTVLESEEATLPLPGATACPGWVYPNAEGAGYLRAHVTGKAWEGLKAEGLKHLTRTERMALLGDAQALAEAGVLPTAEALGLLSRFKDSDRMEVMTSQSLLDLARPIVLRTDAEREARVRLVRELYGARARKLGLVPGKDDSEDVRLLRVQLTQLVGRVGEDPVLGAQARVLAQKWMADHGAVAADMVETVLSIASVNADAAWQAQLLQALRAEKDWAVRDRLLTALGRITRPELIRTQLPLLLLSNEFDPRETIFSVVAQTSSDYRTRDTVYAFVKEHYDALAARLPGELVRGLFFVTDGYCDAEHRAEVSAFYRERSQHAEGGARSLAKILEAMDLCIAFRNTQQASTSAFLAQPRQP